LACAGVAVSIVCSHRALTECTAAMAPRLLGLPHLALLLSAAAPRRAAGQNCSAAALMNNTGCTAAKYAEPHAPSAGACCALCATDTKCQAWTFHHGGACYLSDTPQCRPVVGAVGGCDVSNPRCFAHPSPPDPGVCQPVVRPPAPTPAPLPVGIKKAPHFISIIVDDLGFDDLRSHDLTPGAPSLSPTIDGLLKEGVLLNRHHTYMWCSPTRRSCE
jgi:hypothetical protein